MPAGSHRGPEGRPRRPPPRRPARRPGNAAARHAWHDARCASRPRYLPVRCWLLDVDGNVRGRLRCRSQPAPPNQLQMRIACVRTCLITFVIPVPLSDKSAPLCSARRDAPPGCLPAWHGPGNARHAAGNARLLPAARRDAGHAAARVPLRHDARVRATPRRPWLPLPRSTWDDARLPAVRCVYGRQRFLGCRCAQHSAVPR